MSLVVCVMTPPMHKHAVLLAIVTALVFGGDVVIVDRIAGVERHLTEPTLEGLGLEKAFSLLFDGQGLLAPLFPLCPVRLEGRVHRRRFPTDLGVSGNRDILIPENLGLGFRKDPLTGSDSMEVSLSDPLR
jgi:hypothetical protein